MPETTDRADTRAVTVSVVTVLCDEEQWLAAAERLAIVLSDDDHV